MKDIKKNTYQYHISHSKTNSKKIPNILFKQNSSRFLKKNELRRLGIVGPLLALRGGQVHLIFFLQVGPDLFKNKNIIQHIVCTNNQHGVTSSLV
jgi:hypothetical protein